MKPFDDILTYGNMKPRSTDSWHCATNDNHNNNIDTFNALNRPHKRFKNGWSKEDLLKFSQDSCEFCDELSFCLYDHLVHNAKHIIIPLQDEIVRCPECNVPFANAMDLDIHTKIQHFEVPDLLKSFVMKEPVVKCDNSLTELVIESNEKKLEKILHKKAIVKCDSTVTDLINQSNIKTLTDLVTKQPIVRCDDTIRSMLSEKNKEETKLKPDIISKQNLNKSNNINNVAKLKYVINDEKPHSNKNYNLHDTNKLNFMNNFAKDIAPNDESILSNKSKFRIIFEDDDSDFEDDIITTSVNDAISYLEEERSDKTTPAHNRNEEETVCPVIDLSLDDSDDDLEQNVPEPNFVEREEDMTPSVHYDDLKATCQQECEKCNLKFSNKYDLIVHETKSHFKLKQSKISRKTHVCIVCDSHIVGNHWTLKKHVSTKHPNIISKHKTQSELKYCSKCKLKYYFYPRHCHKYHEICKCLACSKWFENEAQLSEHVVNCIGKVDSVPELFEDRVGIEKVIKVCELCSSFFRTTLIYKYVMLGEYSEQGNRIRCERCKKKFFEVKLIKFINKHPIVQPTYEYQKRYIPVTNDNRLKKIQQRLKCLNEKFK